MENSRLTIEKTIKIKMLVNQTTNLILALCDEYKGLTVFGKNFAEIENRLPGVIRGYFSMLGYEVKSVGVLDSEKKEEFRSIPASICAQALLIEKTPRDSR
jgi:hypothetical protein